MNALPMWKTSQSESNFTHMILYKPSYQSVKKVKNMTTLVFTHEETDRDIMGFVQNYFANQCKRT